MAEESVLQPLLELKVGKFFVATEASSIKMASLSISKKFLVTEVIVGCFDSV